MMRAGDLANALRLAEQGVAGETMCSPAHSVLAEVLLKLGRPAEAEVVIEHAAKCSPGVAETYESLAQVALALGRHGRANAFYRRAAEIGPQVARHWFRLAWSERTFGRLEQAEEACDRSIALDAREYRSYLLRSELRVQSASTHHVEQLRHELARSDLEAHGRVLLGYALGKELDDLGRYGEAFGWFVAAASTRWRQLRYD
ncbi:MAG: tetratricopeptide repeat protein, partial [Steroidobacteraceae bacterium]